MKRNLLLLAVVIGAALFFTPHNAGAQCPQDTVDLGICDTLYVETFDGDHIYDATGSYDSVRVAIYVTHDSNTFLAWPGWPEEQWVQDSIMVFVIPLKFWMEGDADSVVFPGASGWNNNSMNETSTRFPRSMFRHLYNPYTDVTDSNRFTQMVNAGFPGWTCNMDVGRKASGQDSGHVFIDMVPAQADCQWWPEGSRVLFATYTFLVYMHPGRKWAKIDFDSTFWPPYMQSLRFVRYDARAYYPRHFLPVTDSIYDSTYCGLRAEFSAHPESGFVPLQVQFTDSTQGNPTSWRWDFGDGSGDTVRNPPLHVYERGDYDVKLVVSNAQCIDSLIKEDYIHAQIPPLPPCAEESNDLGICDTLYVETFDGDHIYYGTGSYDSVRVAIYVTHDSNTFWYDGWNKWVQDSIMAFVIPLKFWMEGDADSVVFAGKSPYTTGWNNKSMDETNWRFPRSIFRHLYDPNTGVTDSNRFTLQVDNGWAGWTCNMDVGRKASGQDSGHVFLSMVSMPSDCQGWPEGSRVLFATYTFLVYMHPGGKWAKIDFDSTNWGPPANYPLCFVRYDARVYYPRHFLPVTDSIYCGLRADFSAYPESGFVPLQVKFTDLTFGNPTSWLWDFGGGNTDTGQNPAHTYNDTGYFDVMLIVSDSVHSDTIIKPDYIAVFETLTVDFTGQPTSGRKPLNVSFQSTLNEVPDSLTWYFGDGQTSNQLNPVHKYTGFGNYDVKLVAELCGYKDSVTRENYIRVSDIQAKFSASERCGSLPLQVTFTDSSTSTYPIIAWHWDFGDGDTSNQQNPTYQFTSSGVFDVTLIAYDSVGADTLTKQDYITTQDSVSADFIGLPNSGRSPLTVMFEPVLEGIANYYYWNFGDGDTSSFRNPIHTYIAQGKYNVELIVRLELDDCNQGDSITKKDYVIVNDLQAQFNANLTAGVRPLMVQFTDSSSGNPSSWFWDFGDGNNSTEQNPQHQYDTAGVYDVFLRVCNFISCDSLLKMNYIRVDTPYVDLFGEIYGYGFFGPRPGFDYGFYCVWTNVGTIPAENCTLKILFPPQMTFYDIVAVYTRTGTYSGYSRSGDTIIISLQTIDPSGWYGGYVYAYGNIPASVPIGDTLICQMWLTSSTPDRNYDNNYVLFRQVVTGSIDPNDKLASPEGEGISHTIEPDQRLAYTIQFENKPEATADVIYLRVVDTLDQDLDWGSLAIGPSSDSGMCNYEFDPYTGVIVWSCDSIMLPPNQNPPEGEGYFTFSVSPKPHLPEGTEVSNKAWIRFDYNPWLQAPEEGPVIRTIKYPFIRGDANADGVVDISDVVYLLNYLFIHGPAPVPTLDAGDANCDRVVDASDLVYLLNYLFAHGPAPSCK
jgi:PKD repeat protein